MATAAGIREVTAHAPWLHVRKPGKRGGDVEQLLVWAIRDEKAHKIVEAATGGPDDYGGAASMAQIFAEHQMLGVRVDGAGGGGIGLADCHPDAELVYHLAKTNLNTQALRVVIHHAYHETRPDFGADIPQIRWRPVLTEQANGRRRARVFVDNLHGYPRRYCMVSLEDNAGKIVQKRNEYQFWWASLRHLDHVIRVEGGRLTRWQLRPFRLDAEPWEPLDSEKARFCA